MIPYDSLPLFCEKDAKLPQMTPEYKEQFEKANLNLSFGDISNILQGDYHMNGNSRALINIMSNQTVAKNLFYCQFFSILEANYGYYTRRSHVNSYELRYTLEGSGVLEYRGRKYNIEKGDGFFISSMEPHYYYANKDGWKCTVFHINGTLCEEYFQDFASNGIVKFSDETFPAFESLQFQVLQATQKFSPHMRYRISCTLDLLLSELLISSAKNSAKASSAPEDEMITQVISYLQTHFDQKIIFESLAKEFGVSRTVLFNKFRQYTGYTPAAYLTDLRLNNAKLLLRITDLSIEEISESSGFEDPGYFSQVFKKHVGTTPLKFRKR